MRFFLVLFAAIILASCVHLKPPSVIAPPKTSQVESEPMKQRVEFTTDDGVVIVGNWYPVEAATRVALLLHMMPATKESWSELAKELNRRGLSALAIDLRGHGESTMRKRNEIEIEKKNGEKSEKIDFRNFSDKEHQESIRDVRAAVEWLATQGFEKDQILLTGASIGANLALQYASETPEIKKIVLLSPGLDYRGVMTETAIVGLTPDSLLFVIVSQGDNYAAESSEILHSRRPSTRITVVDGNAHGADLFDDHPETLTEVADFLSQ